MNPFLGKSVFPGASLALNPSRGAFAGQARFNGWIVFTSWSREDAAALLPPELELARNTAGVDLHPVVVVFGEQTEGSMLFGGLALPSAPSYPELGIVVPFVKHRGGTYLYGYVPRMYATYFPAVLAGNTYYGFGKERATIQWDRTGTFLVSRDGEGAILHADAEPRGEWSPGSRCELPNFADVRATFALPVLGRKADGTLASSYFGWDFTDAEVRPGDARVAFDAPIVAGFTPRRYDAATSGSFEVRGMVWRLSWPSPCRWT